MEMRQVRYRECIQAMLHTCVPVPPVHQEPLVLKRNGELTTAKGKCVQAVGGMTIQCMPLQSTCAPLTEIKAHACCRLSMWEVK